MLTTEDEIIHAISTNKFYVKKALLCRREVESLYYQENNTIIFPLICFNCGMNSEFVDRNVSSEEIDNKKARSLCIICHTKEKRQLTFRKNNNRRLSSFLNES